MAKYETNNLAIWSQWYNTKDAKELGLLGSTYWVCKETSILCCRIRALSDICVKNIQFRVRPTQWDVSEAPFHITSICLSQSSKRRRMKTNQVQESTQTEKIWTTFLEISASTTSSGILQLALSEPKKDFHFLVSASFASLVSHLC